MLFRATRGCVLLHLSVHLVHFLGFFIGNVNTTSLNTSVFCLGAGRVDLLKLTANDTRKASKTPAREKRYMAKNITAWNERLKYSAEAGLLVTTEDLEAGSEINVCIN
jgi:hypothetical protein